ncbi:MAG: M4 family metallopeptidase [bacterium]|nr:M4 family metallopeptidase [bacterium]
MERYSIPVDEIDRVVDQIQQSSSATVVKSPVPSKYASSGNSSSPQAVPVQISDESGFTPTGQQIRQNLRAFLANSNSTLKDAGTALAQKPKTWSTDPKQNKAIEDMLAKLGQGTKLHMNGQAHTVRFLDGDLQPLIADSKAYQEARAKGDYEKMALVLANEISPVLNIQKPTEEFFAEQITRDELGKTHVILQQQYQDAPIWGAEIGIHFTAGNDPYQVSGVYAPTPSADSIPLVEITPAQAIAAAKAALDYSGEGVLPPKAQRMMYWQLGADPILCYNVECHPRYGEAWEIFVAIDDGRIVHRYDKVVTAAAQVSAKDLMGNTKAFQTWESGGTYYAIDTTLPMYDAAASAPPNYDKLKGALYAFDFMGQDPRDQNAKLYPIQTNNPANFPPDSVSLMTYYPMIDQYYRGVFNRNSIDNKGLNVVFMINFTWAAGDQIGQTHNENACWVPSMNMMFYGDGDKLAGGKLPYALDIVAHEYTHGVTGFEAGLIYELQSGALDEAFSDFFACMIDREDWLLAEDIVKLGENKTKIAMRDMSYPGNPQVTSPNPAVMAEYQYLSTDYDHGGVHINCGIPSYMLYLLADGGNYAIGKDKTEKIVYRARNEYLTQRSQFLDFRFAMLTAAKDLYGDNSAEMQACAKAADAVGITENQTPPSQPSTPGTVVQGDEMIVFLAADPSAGTDPIRDMPYYNLFIYSYSANQYLPLTLQYVANARPAISGNGEWGLFINAFNDIFITNGAQEQQITFSGVVRTIAMSKDQHYIAYTTIDKSNVIYLYDMMADKEYAVLLQVPLNSEYTSVEPLNYADVMTFNFRGDYLMFDATKDVRLTSGQIIEAWGLYSLRLADLLCAQVLPPQQGLQFGDPLFAHTNDALMMADMVTTNEQGNEISNTVTINFETGKIHLLLENMGILTRPSSWGSDEGFVFVSIDPQAQQFVLADGQLKPDWSGIVQNSLRVILPAYVHLEYPVAFRSGEYEAQKGSIAVASSLDFGEVPVGGEMTKTLLISNQGNADLQVLSITLGGQQADVFAHNGLDTRIAPGSQYSVLVRCRPQISGAIQATLRIQSTDISKPDLSVTLQGTASGEVQPTPTNPPATPTPVGEPTSTPITPPTVTPVPPTPTPEPTPTQTSGGSVEPLVVYEFEQLSLAENGWKEIPGGFTGSPAGTIHANSFVGQRIPSSQDQVGLQFAVDPGEVAFIHAMAPIETGGKPVLVRAVFRSDSAAAAVAVAALKGDLSTGQGIDASILSNIPAEVLSAVDQEYQSVMLYEPDTATVFSPILQVAVAGSAAKAANVLVDKVEVYRLDQANFAGEWFGSMPGKTGTATSPSAITPMQVYEFDQLTLADNGWKAVPGGFSGAPAGSVGTNSFVGQLIPASQDKVGIELQVQPSQVTFIHGIEPVQTNGMPLLIRALIRSDAPGASVGLAALKGNLTNGQGIDGSIVQHIPASAVSMQPQTRVLDLICPSNSAGLVTPILQLASNTNTTVRLFVDRVEIYQLQPALYYPASVFAAVP